MAFTSERSHEEVYTAWLMGEEISPTEREEMDLRYRDDATFRTETDKLRATAEFLKRNIDPILALIDPAPPLSAHKQEELWEEFQALRQTKRIQKKTVFSSRARAAKWNEAQWNKLKENLKVLVGPSINAKNDVAVAPILAMQAASDETELQTAQLETDPGSSVPVRIIKCEIRGTETGGTVRLELNIQGEQPTQFAGWFVATWLDAGVEGWLEIDAAPVSAQGRVNAVMRENRFTLSSELSGRLRFTLRSSADHE